MDEARQLEMILDLTFWNDENRRCGIHVLGGIQIEIFEILGALHWRVIRPGADDPKSNGPFPSLEAAKEDARKEIERQYADLKYKEVCRLNDLPPPRRVPPREMPNWDGQPLRSRVRGSPKTR